MKAVLYRYRQSPRKVRLVANLIKGKSVDEAIGQLKFLEKRASGPLAKVIESAVANAINNLKLARERLMVKEIRVDNDVVLKRFRPGARGTAYRLKKRTSQVRVVLGERVVSAKK